MKANIRLVTSAVLAMTVAACASSGSGFEALKADLDPGVTYKDIMDAELNTRDYSKWLEKDYKALAVFEYVNMYDYDSGNHFANKSLRAGRGADVRPDLPSSRKIDVKYREEAVMAYNIVFDSYRQKKDTYFPKEMARLQVSYDCWLEQIEEGWQKEHIMKCRDLFFDALANMKGLEFTTVVYFENDSFDIVPAEAEKLKAIVANYKIRRQDILIEGHTDAKGTDAYNQKLSERRAEVTADYLEKALSRLDRDFSRQSAIKTEGFGESKLAVPTADGVSEPRNRRAIIHFR